MIVIGTAQYNKDTRVYLIWDDQAKGKKRIMARYPEYMTDKQCKFQRS